MTAETSATGIRAAADRFQSWDERLPDPGDGSAEWQGLLPWSARPHAIDPAQHWLANWNTLPSQAWTTGSDQSPARSVPPGPAGHNLDRLAAGVARYPSFDGLTDLIMHPGTIAQQRPLATRELRAAAASARGGGGGATVVLRTILAWEMLIREDRRELHC